MDLRKVASIAKETFRVSLVALAISVPTHSMAMPSKADELTREFEKIKDNTLAADRATRMAMGSLYQLNKNLKKMSQQRSKLVNKMLAAEADVKGVAKQVVELEDSLKAQKRLLRTRMRALYTLSGDATLRVIFSAVSRHDFDRNLNFLKRVADRDYQIILRYRETLDSLENEKKRLRSEVIKLASIRKRFKKQEQLITVRQDEKLRIIEKLRSQKSENLVRLKTLRKQAKNVKSKVDSPFEDGERLQLDVAFFEEKGKLAPPIQGGIAQGFGLIYHNTYRYRLNYKGVFINAPEGAKIQAVFEGTVAFVGELPGYGSTVVVDHGDNYYTVYTHLKEAEVRPGQQLANFAVIGKVGLGDSRFGAGIHFEVRHFSDALDPQQWLRGPTKVTQNQYGSVQ